VVRLDTPSVPSESAQPERHRPADARCPGGRAGDPFLHETAFNAKPEITNVVVDDDGAAAEAWFVGTHIGDLLARIQRPSGWMMRNGTPMAVVAGVGLRA
jgi:hypothetical protein